LHRNGNAGNNVEHEENEHGIQNNAEDDKNENEVEHTEMDMDADQSQSQSQSQSRELRLSRYHAPVPSLFESESDEPANAGPRLGLVTVMITNLRQTQTTSTLYTISSIIGAIVLRLEEDRKIEITVMALGAA
jgi:hypothetical protein